MADTTITNSPNLTSLGLKIIADVCLGKFYIDTTPSVWITNNSASPAFNGALNVLGVKVQITNPYGVIIKSYGSSYDIAPPMTSVYEGTIPTQAGTTQYGTYTVSLELTDSGGTTKYYVSKTINVCTYDKNQNPCDDRLRLVASCKNGTLTVYVSEPPLFKGVYAQSKTQSWTVEYPTSSGHANTVSAYGYFSVQLFEGVYNVSGSVCAMYNLGDSVYIRLPYTVSLDKNVKCLLDYTCIYPRIKQLNDKIDSDCSQADKDANASTVLDALRLIKSAELANDAGEDASDYIEDLEVLLGCKCTCDCSGSPIVNGAPSTNMAITGCNVIKTTVGLTDIYTINNYEYIVEVNDTLGILTLSAPAITNCIKTQTLSVSVANMYAAIKTRVSDSTEYGFWASVINNPLNAIDASCLGYTTATWTALTFAQKIAAIINKACSGGNCSAVIASTSTSRSGADIILTWTSIGALYVQIWVDGDFVDAKNSNITSITLPGFANGQAHTYEIKPFCANNVEGTPSIGSFNQLGCPAITAPTVATTLATNVACPYSLTGLVGSLPFGINAEWHNLPNTNSSSLVPNAAAVTDGVYYVYAKDSNGCYSTGVQVIVTCQISGTVTAPQSLVVTPQFGSLLVQFQSAAFPPPANSYTLKRRLASAPDVSGSYTTLGSTGTGIAWNSSTNMWELSDVTAVAATLYVYRAISNGGTSPYIDITYANLTCPTLTLIGYSSTIGFSFSPIGGSVDKYVIELYNSTETTLLETITKLPGSPTFSNPTTGTFVGSYYSPSGLPSGNYRVRVKVYIGTYFTTCAFQSITSGSDSITGTTYVNLFNPSMSGTIVINSPGGRTMRLSNFSVCGVSNAQVIISGGVGTIGNNITSGVSNANQNVDTLIAAGTYTYTGSITSGCTSSAGITLI